VVEPRIAFCPKPKYPQVARDRKLEGSVRVQIEILPDGSTGDVFVIRSSGFAELDQAAVENLKKECKFFPGQRGGKPVTRRAERTIRFSLEEAE
jgi:protein TonB